MSFESCVYRNLLAAALLCLCLMLPGGARAFARQDVERDIAAALEQQGVGQGVKVTLFTSRTDIMRYRSGAYRIAEVRADPATQKLEAEIAFDAGGEEKTLTLEGRYTLMIRVPAPSARINPGDVIGEDDLHWVEVDGDRRQSNWVLTVEPLVGKTPKRVLFPGKPIDEASLKTPDVVHRNDPVSI
ncbi:MAG: flagella basal body P-ring formation protein FlgA, partial [Alphaproteobacteria bacterium]|nr:flagella basal body P-ring formation protein FlgA [Alphaproteobacteria bacterium]